VGDYSPKNGRKKYQNAEVRLDLGLGDEAYAMTKVAIKPFGDDYEHFLTGSSYAQRISFAGETILTPEKNHGERRRY
jgi:hypothetical protein